MHLRNWKKKGECEVTSPNLQCAVRMKVLIGVGFGRTDRVSLAVSRWSVLALVIFAVVVARAAVTPSCT
jgi:hypothetical protein